MHGGESKWLAWVWKQQVGWHLLKGQLTFFCGSSQKQRSSNFEGRALLSYRSEAGLLSKHFGV